MHTFRTVLEQQIKERRQTLEEFVEYAEVFAREHEEAGTLSLRHLQRLIAGYGAKGQPLGTPRPATVRLLENIFDRSIDELLGPPAQTTLADSRTAELDQGVRSSNRATETEIIRSFGQIEPDRQVWRSDPSAVHSDGYRLDLSTFFDWLDEQAGWIPDTARRKVMSRLAKISRQELMDQRSRRARVTRSQIASALSEYYGDYTEGSGAYRVHWKGKDILTSIAARPEWLDLACPLSTGSDRLILADSEPDGLVILDDLSARYAVRRLAEAVALNVRITNAPIYRLWGIDVRSAAISGTVGMSPFRRVCINHGSPGGRIGRSNCRQIRYSARITSAARQVSAGSRVRFPHLRPAMRRWRARLVCDRSTFRSVSRQGGLRPADSAALRSGSQRHTTTRGDTEGLS